MDKLYAFQCRTCKRRSVAAQNYCFTCRSQSQLERVEVEGTAVVFSFTTIHGAGEKVKNPLTLAVVEYDGSLRLLGRIREEDAGKVAIGKNVQFAAWQNESPVFTVI